nr:uncharacterized protein ci-zf(bed)-1 [Ciona intestinalis]|eukprot:XP_026694487.1 uncharacterized protein ci-zf(bed)-1 [Ciona intestinalis]
MTSFANSLNKVPAVFKQKIEEAALKFVSVDMHPFSAIEGKGLQSLITSCMELTAKHGIFSSEDILPSGDTLKRHADAKAKTIKKVTVEQMKEAIKEYGNISVTTDMWTDMKSCQFLSLTAHFMLNGRLTSQVLTVSEVTDGKTSPENIRKAVESIFTKLGFSIQEFASHVYFVTSNEANIKNALMPFCRIPCSCHMLATVAQHTLQLQSSSQISDFPPNEPFGGLIKTTVVAVKKLAAYFKKSGLNLKLNTSIQQSNETGWNSIYTMLESVLNNKSDIISILISDGLEERFDGIDWRVVETLVHFLKPFLEIYQTLEIGKYPTIQSVFLCYSTLERNFITSPTDTGIIKCLKNRGRICLKEKFEITDIHYVGFFLNPKFKYLIPFTTEEKKRIQKLVKDLVTHFLHGQNEPTRSHVDYAYDQPAMKKKRNCVEDNFLDWQEKQPAVHTHDEVELYIRTTFDDSYIERFQTDERFNILKFWNSKTVRTEFPNLSRVALGVLSIPASSVDGERAFSFCGNRSRLSDSTLESLIVLNTAENNCI